MIMEFEENFLDNIISECTNNTLFDEYVNYEQIVSESLVLSESQEIKLSILREVSMKDIGKRIAGAFKAIKTFISNLILKLNVFIKNIGKDKIFKEVGKAISELSPEERKEIIEYNYCNEFKLIGVDPKYLKNIDNCINYAMKALKSKNEDVDVSLDDIKNKYGISDVEDFEIDADTILHWEKKSGTKIEAYKHYTMISKKLDEAHNYFIKLSNKFSAQADKLEKLTNNWIDEDGDNYKFAADISRQILLPGMKENTRWLKKRASVIANNNRRILTEAIGLIKRKDAEELSKEKFADKLEKFDAKDSTNESYTPWNDLD